METVREVSLLETVKEGREQRGCMGSGAGETCLSRVWETDRIYFFSGSQRVVWTNSTSSLWELAGNEDSQASPTESATLGTRHSHLDCKRP